MTTEETFIDFKCPHCGELNSFQADTAGHVRECVNCMEALIVPDDGSDEGRKIPLPVTMPKLVLRRFGPDDWKDLLDFMCDDEADALKWLENDRKVKLTAIEQTFSLAAELRDGGKVIAAVGLRFTDREFLEAEVFISLNEKSRAGDYCAEALDAALGLCFQGLSLHRVVARCGGADAEACRLFEAAGMRREGEFVKHYRVNEAWQNTIWFAMLEEEYRVVGGGVQPATAGI